MKYDRKAIMKKAWEIKKENEKNIFALCLKMAWAIAKKEAEAKELPELQGSVKQVAWAKDIRRYMINTLSYESLFYSVKGAYTMERMENLLGIDQESEDYVYSKAMEDFRSKNKKPDRHSPELAAYAQLRRKVLSDYKEKLYKQFRAYVLCETSSKWFIENRNY